MKKKQIIIILAIFLVLLTLILLFVFNRDDKDLVYDNIFKHEGYTPEFMNAQEKNSFNLPEDSKIQVLKRDESGQVDVYKIIREDVDVEYNLEALRRPLR